MRAIELYENIGQLKRYLKMMADIHTKAEYQNKELKYQSIEEFVLRHGREWKSQPLPKGIRKGPQKDCFRSAIKLAYSYNYSYVEGYIFFHSIAIHHAWCLDENNIVVDNTLDNPETYPYFGVAFDSKWAVSQVMQKGEANILDDVKRRFPLLTGKIVPKFA